jgi:hypothetical protein
MIDRDSLLLLLMSYNNVRTHFTEDVAWSVTRAEYRRAVLFC